MAVFIGFLLGDHKPATKTVTKVESVSTSSSNSSQNSKSSESSSATTSSKTSSTKQVKPYQNVVYSFRKTNSAGTVDVDYSIILRSDGTATQQLINRAQTSPNIQLETDTYAVNDDGQVRFLKPVTAVDAEYGAPGDILSLPPKSVSWTGKGSDTPNQAGTVINNGYQIRFKGDDYSKLLTNEVGLYATQSGAPEPNDPVKLGQQLQDQYTQDQSGN